MTLAADPPAVHHRLRRAATFASLSLAGTLLLAKLAIWFVTGSVTILSSALDSLSDLAASTITFFSIRAALRPADRSHRFGHGKAEPLGALAQAAFVAGSGLVVLFQAANRLVVPEPIQQPDLGMIVMAAAILLTLAVVLFQTRVVRVTGSLAIRADRAQYIGDILANLAAAATLALIEWTGLQILDPLVAAAIAGYLLVSAVRIGRGALDLLMDRELPSAERARIRQVVLSDARVRGLHDLRTRSSGTADFIELHLELDGHLTLDRAHDITDDVESALSQAFPKAEILLHQEPHGLDDERLDQRLAR